MKLTLQLKLLPDTSQAAKLLALMERFNEAANWLARRAFERGTANKILLQRLHYREVRERFGLSAQATVRCISQVCEAYKRDRSKRPTFRPRAAVPYDHNIMSFKGIDKVSLLTLEGRVIVPFIMGKYQAERFGGIKGQADLVYRGGKWFLLATVNLPDGTPTPATDFIGVDLGVVNIATDSDGEIATGEKVEEVRVRYLARRTKLQKAAVVRKRRGKRPRGIRRALVRASGREARFKRDTNHRIAKRIVAKAKGTGRGIALEDLKGIRERTRFRRRQRARMAGWSFHQLRAFIEYKASLAGIAVAVVEQAGTSWTCPECGHSERANRKSQDRFVCRACGFKQHADIVGARNIRARALAMVPMVSGMHDASPPQGQAAGL